MTQFNKLVRDKIPEILDQKGVAYEMRIAGAEEYAEELVKKLAEEAAEFAGVASSEELADVLEVVEALKQLPKYSDVETIRKSKHEERGGFARQIILKGEK